MVAISIMIEGQNGLTWPLWKRLVAEVDELGFAGLFRSDHFTNPNPPDMDSLEMLVSLAYVASHTRHIHFGPLVAPVSMRDPIMLTRQAAALDDLSEGRMILGLGAGWQEREHHLFGYRLGAVSTRMNRLEEGLEVATRLLKSDETVTYEGNFFQLHDAKLLPRPQRPGGPQILVGGLGPKRTLPLVAHYANIWNAAFLTPQAFQERSALLDTLLQKAGRKPEDVKRTMMLSMFFGRDMDALDRKLSWRHNEPELSDKPLDAVLDILKARQTSILGTADMAIEQIRAYAAAGVEELMLQWFDLDDIENLRAFATSVLPHVSGQ